MPWCEGCSKFLNPNTLQSDGTCPECGRRVADPPDPNAAAAQQDKVPWHFKLLVAVTVVYLGFRLVQMIGWLIT